MNISLFSEIFVLILKKGDDNMCSNLWIYDTDPSNLYRFSLGCSGRKPLVCFGVNPSTATPEKLDPTIKSVKRIASFYGYDGWIMFNLYPQRSTNPDNLDLEADKVACEKNLEMIKLILRKYEVNEIWAAWGTLISKRSYLVDCLYEIYSEIGDYNWITFGETSKKGHPHHPLYLKTNSEKKEFDILSYIAKL